MNMHALKTEPDAAVEAGYPTTDDVNGFRQEGFGRLDMTVHDGRRWSAADAYLRPAMSRPNLLVRIRASREQGRHDRSGARGVGTESRLRRCSGRSRPDGAHVRYDV